MNKNHIDYLKKNFEIGDLKQAPKKVHGGLLHQMWKLNTTCGVYAVKQLAEDINLIDSNIVKKFELTELIACRFKNLDIPAISAIKKNDKFLFIIEDVGYLLYPWVNAKVFNEKNICHTQALKIASILAKMHDLNLPVDQNEPEFEVYEEQQVLKLVKLARDRAFVFYDVLEKNLDIFLEINHNYHSAIPTLKAHSLISHGDLNLKNVLWDDENNPSVIDWEFAGKLNPTYEILNTALGWSGIAAHFNLSLFEKMIKNYQESGGKIDKLTLEAAFWGVLGNWFNWLVYNIKRSMFYKNLNQQQIAIKEVNKVLTSILRLQNLMIQLINTVKNSDYSSLLN